MALRVTGLPSELRPAMAGGCLPPDPRGYLHEEEGTSDFMRLRDALS
ncbi:hypothetical protein SAMN05421772_104131 [Paracoccus saliphilus]|uniref:Uncharacterized protein n=1 Tax=Paracoccus saliphilus TaxID=405559 RepID=A0AA45W3J8_9RHOB|nr:hypothetical protein SAMN05421772_104131 [Paracoccus saliphilus]